MCYSLVLVACVWCSGMSQCVRDAVVAHCESHRQIEVQGGAAGEEDVVNAQDVVHWSGVNSFWQKLPLYYCFPLEN